MRQDICGYGFLIFVWKFKWDMGIQTFEVTLWIILVYWQIVMWYKFGKVFEIEEYLIIFV